MEMSFGYGKRKALKQVTKSCVLLNKHNIRHIAGSAIMADKKQALCCTSKKLPAEIEDW